MNVSSLPGIGKKVSFVNKENQMMCMIIHHSGKRELYFFQDADDDEAIFSFNLSSDETKQLGAQMLGATMDLEANEKLERLQFIRKQVIVEWLEINKTSPFAGKKYDDLKQMLPSDVSVVGVIKEEEFLVRPESELVLDIGDIVMAVGKREPMKEFMNRCEKGAGS